MSLDYKAIKEELDQNDKAIIQLSNKKFLVKKSKDKYKIRPIYFWVIRLILHVISFFIVAFPISFVLVILREIAKSYSTGFPTIINIIAFTIVAVTMYRVYNFIGYIAMNKFHKNEKKEILAGLNPVEKGMPVEEFAQIFNDLQEVAEKDENAIDEFNAILDKAEKRINDIENEQ